MKGIFITLEGPEGSGKSTQAKRLAERLHGAGTEVLLTREPGGTPAGEIIRSVLQTREEGNALHPEAEVLLFAASRAQLAREVISPALERGRWVICDRFGDSTVAYQGYGRGMDVQWIIDLNRAATADLVPDLTVLLDIDVADGMDRMRARNLATGQSDDRFEREDPAYHENVRNGYLALAKRWPERFEVIAGGGAVEGVAEAVWAAVSRRVGREGMLRI